MAKDWEAVLRGWAKPASDTEEEKCNNATSMIKDAISTNMAHWNVEVFPQGSYHNNTNVRQNSDVDICACLKDSFFYHLPTGYTAQQFGIGPAPITFSDYKNLVEAALVAKFGRQGVRRGNKAFDIHENTYRVDADVVPCFEYREYTGNFDRYGNAEYLSGVEFVSDSGLYVINWPRQHYDNGVLKNRQTGNRFKYITRAMKRLRYEMTDIGYDSAKPIPSFLLECLFWNVPNDGFQAEQYFDNVRWCLAYLCNDTENDELCGTWTEVNQVKPLWGLEQAWTRAQAKAFLEDTWCYIGYQ